MKKAFVSKYVSHTYSCCTVFSAGNGNDVSFLSDPYS